MGPPETLVYGLAPEGAAAVAVTPTEGGEAVRAPTVSAGDDLLFVARLVGRTGVAYLAALSEDDAVLAAFEGPALPPPAGPEPVLPEDDLDARRLVQGP